MTNQDTSLDSLLAAIESGDVTAAIEALDAGAPLSGRDSDDWSPLDRAAGRGNTDMVRLLLDHGADPTATGTEGRTPYQIALAAAHLDAARLLRTAQETADPASAEEHVWRPYCKAYQLGRLRSAPMWSDDAGDLADDTIVYLHDDHSVTRSIWRDEDVVFAGHDPQWAAYCRDELDFRIPDDFDLVPPAHSMGSS